MPTKKRRVGFIPRSDVLDLINKLSFESNLSISKIINILPVILMFINFWLTIETVISSCKTTIVKMIIRLIKKG